MTTGLGQGSKKMEIVDLADPTNVCQPSFLDEYPKYSVKGASAGPLINNNALFLVICGGFAFERLDDCFAISENGLTATTKLSQPRSWAASVVLNSTTLWLTGGWLMANIQQIQQN
jgi:hypothetical protein